MRAQDLLEDLIAQFNGNVFLGAFSFSSAEIPFIGAARPDLADRIVVVDDIGFIFQLNEWREAETTAVDDLEEWFASEVLRKGVKRIRQTRELLRSYATISLVNDLGHRMSIGPRAGDLVGVILYRTCPTMEERPLPRFHWSPTAGFVHVLRAEEYFCVSEYLVTPAEIFDYFRFRREVVSKPAFVPESVTEQALVGQYLAEEMSSIPGTRFERAALSFREDRNTAAFAFVMESLGDRIAHQEEEDADTDCYRILTELAKLSGSELRELKAQVRLTLEAVRADRLEPPFRIASSLSDCAFLLLPVATEFRRRAREALENISLASRHELKSEKHVSLAMWQTGELIDIEWMFIEGPNLPDPELDASLRRHYPFRRTSDRRLLEYFL